MVEVTCEIDTGTTTNRESVDANSEAVAKNGALMKLASDIETDRSSFEIECWK